MAVGFRAASATWTEITTDLATVAIPGSPQAGDRMYLLVAWKDFNRTLTVSGWTSCGAAFADGSVASGNGTGSMKVQAFYRDWQSGDAAPALDWDATTNLLARACILVMTKGASENWQTPLWNTAAWPATSTTQTVSASATTAVPSNGAVLAFIGLRDDSATFTRAATTGIDVSSGITWNGNYAEQPPTHHSTTTGNDGAGDAGYRLVTTGGTVTLRVTATITATETGSVGWVTQGVQVADNKVATPDAFSLTFTGAAPTVTTTDNKLVTPSAFSLAFTGAAPTVSTPVVVTPSAFSLAFTGAAPSVVHGTVVTPSAFSLAFTGAVPDVIVESAGTTVTPGAFSLAFTGAVPTVTATDHKTVTPGAFSLAWTGAVPTVTVAANIVVTPDAFSLTWTGAQAIVTRTGPFRPGIAGGYIRS